MSWLNWQEFDKLNGNQKRDDTQQLNTASDSLMGAETGYSGGDLTKNAGYQSAKAALTQHDRQASHPLPGWDKSGGGPDSDAWDKFRQRFDSAQADAAANLKRSNAETDGAKFSSGPGAWVNGQWVQGYTTPLEAAKKAQDAAAAAATPTPEYARTLAAPHEETINRIFGEYGNDYEKDAEIRWARSVHGMGLSNAAKRLVAQRMIDQGMPPNDVNAALGGPDFWKAKD